MSENRLCSNCKGEKHMNETNDAEILYGVMERARHQFGLASVAIDNGHMDTARQRIDEAVVDLIEAVEASTREEKWRIADAKERQDWEGIGPFAREKAIKDAHDRQKREWYKEV